MGLMFWIFVVLIAIIIITFAAVGWFLALDWWDKAMMWGLVILFICGFGTMFYGLHIRIHNEDKISNKTIKTEIKASSPSTSCQETGANGLEG